MKDIKNKKKIYLLITIGILSIIVILFGSTFAYWRITAEQTEENIVGADCFNIEFTGKNDITINDAHPLKEEELESFLASETPYHFTITNKCSSLATATINLESINAEGEKQLSDEWIDAILYQDDYHEKLNRSTKLTGNPNNDENKVVVDALHAYILKRFTLKANETKEYNLLLYLDPEIPLNNETTNASWQGKITLSADYKQNRFTNSGILRKLNNQIDEEGNLQEKDYSGMWQYRESIRKIVIEPSISEKVASEVETLYGPFDEGTDDNPVKSYVICNNKDGCTGYLQGEGGIKLNPDSSGLFADFYALTEIDGMEYLDTSEVTNMSHMFDYVTIPELDLSYFDTSNVTNMSHMFSGSRINKIDITNFDTHKVENMEYLFSDFGTLNLDLSYFDTSNVKTMKGMFNSNPLNEIDLSGFNTSNVTDMSYMFAETNFQTLDLSHFNTKNVTNMSYMFYNIPNIQELDLSNFNTKNVENMSYMFDSLQNVRTLDLSSFDTSSVTIMEHMFNFMPNLQELNLSNWKFYSYFGDLGIASITGFIESSLNKLILKNIDVSEFGTSKIFSDINANNVVITDLDLSNSNQKIFENSQITNLNMENIKFPIETEGVFDGLNVENLTIKKSSFDNAENMFNGIQATNVDITGIDFSKKTSIKGMFGGATISTLNMNNTDFRNLKNIEDLEKFYIFCNSKDCENTSAKINNIIATNVKFPTNADSFFEDIIINDGEITIDLENSDFSNVTSLERFFPGANVLTIKNFVFPKDSSRIFLGNTSSAINFVNIDTSNVIKMYSMFSDMSNISEIDLSKFNTQNVEDMSWLFSNSSYTRLDLTGLDTRNVETMGYMFERTSNLQELNLQTLNTSNVDDMEGMFNTTGLTTLDLSNFDTNKVVNMKYMFAGAALTNITYGPNFVHNPACETYQMFGLSSENLCQANKPNTSTWQDVEY